MSTENAKQYDVYFAETILKYILSKDELSVTICRSSNLNSMI